MKFRFRCANLLIAASAFLLSLTCSMRAEANVIFSASNAVLEASSLSSSSVISGSLASTFDQSGLVTAYNSGTSSFAGYIASNPLHTAVPGSAELKITGTPPITITYILPEAIDLTHIALWNEDQDGVALFNALASSDGAIFVNIVNSASPTNNPAGSPYGPDVYNFAAVEDITQVRFEFFGPGSTGGLSTSDTTVALGEVAFGGTSSSAGVVPEPTSFAIWGLMVGAVGCVRRRMA
ncbi:MAG: hypothetical protein VXZ82_22735 [Planctomycetota bacterium]|nr:hypothetical protein [Planctomycetota bacterium]